MSNPNLDLYTAESERKGLVPRCPFASVDRCPRYYSSLSLLGEAGNTRIDPEEDKRLEEKWRRSDLWPKTNEQATSIMGPSGNPKHFLKFCPEVSFDAFGLFATNLLSYADDLDSENAHRVLGEEAAGPEDWRWHWSAVTPMHYTECPLYSLLAGGGSRDVSRGRIGFR